MRWTERQRAMLGAMGVRLWLPPSVAVVGTDGVADPDDAPVDAQANAASATASTDATTAQATAVPAESRRPQAADGDAPGLESGARAGRMAAGAAVDPAHAPVEAAALDWTALRQAVAGCTACKLCASRRQTVFGTGFERAHWMIVGEAPGEQEDREGEPFVGKSGELLDNMLRSIGLGRAVAPPAAARGAEGDAPEVVDPSRQVYICNTVKCRPPGNRNPEPEELAACEAYLVRQIELLQPRIILAMGRFAVQSLLKSSEPIGRLRGRVHRYLGLPLIVTYHPAYLLRNGEDKTKAWDDLCLAVETVQSAGEPQPRATATPPAPTAPAAAGTAVPAPLPLSA